MGARRRLVPGTLTGCLISTPGPALRFGAPMWSVKQRRVACVLIGGRRGAVSDHGVQGEDAAAFQNDEGPARALSLGDLAVAVSAADRDMARVSLLLPE